MQEGGELLVADRRQAPLVPLAREPNLPLAVAILRHTDVLGGPLVPCEAFPGLPPLVRRLLRPGDQ